MVNSDVRLCIKAVSDFSKTGAQKQNATGLELCSTEALELHSRLKFKLDPNSVTCKPRKEETLNLNHNPRESVVQIP